MNSECVAAGSVDPSDLAPERVLLPYGWIGPVWRIRSDARSIRRRWNNEAARWGLLAILVAGLPMLVGGAVRYGLDSRVFFLEQPAVFWAVLAAFPLSRLIVGARLVRRHRARIEPLAWARVGPDLRLEASHEAVSSAHAGLHAALMGVLTISNAALALIASGSYSWIFGPLSVLFAVEAVTWLRVFQLRRRRHPTREESTASGP